MIVYLDKTDIIYINQQTIKIHGGNYVLPYNFLNENSLDYLMEAVQSEMFGEPMYPSISDKASLYAYNIICNHIFSDGNKRTGLESALAFLKLNNHQLRESVSNEELTEFILSVASGVLSLDECKSWFELNTISLLQGA